VHERVELLVAEESQALRLSTAGGPIGALAAAVGVARPEEDPVKQQLPHDRAVALVVVARFWYHPWTVTTAFTFKCIRVHSIQFH